jgi:pentatricopeptide repeat domain-containing protein 1
LEDALHLLSQIEETHELVPDRICYNICIDACARAHRRSEVEVILAEMSRRGVEPDVVSYTTAITACSQQGEWHEAFRFLKTMRSKGVVPTTITLNAVMSVCEKSGQYKKAIELLETMVTRLNDEHEARPNIITFSTAISACAKQGKYTDALKLLSTMKMIGFKPNLICYNSAANASAKAGYLPGVREIMRAIRTQGLEPNVRTYQAAIEACEKRGHWEIAIGFMDEMKKLGFKLDEFIYCTAISACGKSGEPQQALHLFKGMVQRDGVQPNTAVVNAVMQAFAMAKDPGKALKMFAELKSLGLTADEVSYNLAIGALEQLGNYEDAVDLIDKARVQRCFESVWAGGIDWIDLHGCPVPTARAIVRSLLRDLQSGLLQPWSDITIITGRGNNSPGNLAVLPREIHRILQDAGLSPIVPPDNPGKILLSLEDVRRTAWALAFKK